MKTAKEWLEENNDGSYRLTIPQPGFLELVAAIQADALEAAAGAVVVMAKTMDSPHEYVRGAFSKTFTLEDVRQAILKLKVQP